MILALVIFAVTYLLMLALPKERPWVALCSAAVFMALGQLGVYDFSLSAALGAVDYNVLLMMYGTMGIVSLFIRSRMPARLAEQLIVRVPNAQWAVCVLALFAGVISAFVDNVATVLMVAPVGLAIARKLKISPVPVIIAIAVSSNLQGAATLVGDTTSILLGGFAEMNFIDFFWMHGRPGVFWGVELGALTSLLVLLWLFRKEKQPITARVETQVEDDVPTALMLLTVGLLIVASFLPQPDSGLLAALYELRSGLICMTLCVVGVVRAWEDPFRLHVLLVVVSVVLSAFIDNIPYVATMLPVVQGIAALMNNGAGMAPEVFYFGLLTGATLGGNLTPIGASANIAAIGILRKNGETVRTADFLRIGVPFTLAAVLTGSVYLWLVWGRAL